MIAVGGDRWIRVLNTDAAERVFLEDKERVIIADQSDRDNIHRMQWHLDISRSFFFFVKLII